MQENSPLETHYQRDTSLYASEKEEVLLNVQFDFRQWKAEMLVLAVTMIFTIVGLPFLIFLPLAFLRFRYIFHHRRCYVTRTAIVLFTMDPAFIICLPNRTEKTVQLSKIVDITVQQSWAQKLFGVCTIQIQNPGQTVRPDGLSISDMSLTGIEESQAQHVKRQLLSLANSVKRGDDINMQTVNSLGLPEFEDPSVLTESVGDIRQSLLRIEKLLEASHAMV